MSESYYIGERDTVHRRSVTTGHSCLCSATLRECVLHTAVYKSHTHSVLRSFTAHQTSVTPVLIVTLLLSRSPHCLLVASHQSMSSPETVRRWVDFVEVSGQLPGFLPYWPTPLDSVFVTRVLIRKVLDLRVHTPLSKALLEEANDSEQKLCAYRQLEYVPYDHVFPLVLLAPRPNSLWQVAVGDQLSHDGLKYRVLRRTFTELRLDRMGQCLDKWRPAWMSSVMQDFASFMYARESLGRLNEPAERALHDLEPVYKQRAERSLNGLDWLDKIFEQFAPCSHIVLEYLYDSRFPMSETENMTFTWIIENCPRAAKQWEAQRGYLTCDSAIANIVCVVTKRRTHLAQLETELSTCSGLISQADRVILSTHLAQL